MPRYTACPLCGDRIDTSKKARVHVCEKQAVMDRAVPYDNVRSITATRANVPDLNRVRGKKPTRS